VPALDTLLWAWILPSGMSDKGRKRLSLEGYGISGNEFLSL